MSTKKFAVGDKITISEFYRNHYFKWKIGSGIGVITQVFENSIGADKLSGADRAMFISKYGVMETFPLNSMFIKLDDGNETYLVSEFGIEAASP